jgi:hypothetical protein
MCNIFQFLRDNGDAARSVAAIASAVIAFCALFFSMFVAQIQRKHNWLSVRPIPRINSLGACDAIGLNITNVGCGPLILSDVSFEKNGATEKNIRPLYHQNLQYMPPTMAGHGFDGSAVTPNSNLNILMIGSNVPDARLPAEITRIKSELQGVVIKIRYTDIYKQKFDLFTHQLTF